MTARPLPDTCGLLLEHDTSRASRVNDKPRNRAIRVAPEAERAAGDTEFVFRTSLKRQHLQSVATELKVSTTHD